MNNTTTANDHSRFVTPALTRRHDDPSWLRDKRAVLRRRWQATPPPTLRSEAYRYTNLKPLLAENFGIVTGESTVATADYEALLHTDEYRCVIAEGEFVVGTNSLPTGVQCLSLRQAIASGTVSAAALQLQTDEDYLQLLTDVCFYDGIYVQVAAGVRLDRPLHIIFVNGARAAHNAMFSRNVIRVEDQATAHIIESHYGTIAASYLAQVRTIVHVGAGGDCALAKFQHEGTEAYHYSAVSARQEQDSHFSLLNISYGGKLARLDSHIVQLAAGACCDFRTLYLGKARQVLDNYSHVEHLDEGGTTRQHVRGIVREQARGIFSGCLNVPRQAQRTDATQLTKNLLFGKECAVYIKPQLRIEADDVQCSHGATSSRIAATDLHYLASRGIDPSTAAQLLCRAHVEELLQDLPIATAQRFFEMVLADFLREQEK